METSAHIVTTLPATPESPETRFPAWLRFALLCTLFMLVSVWLEPHLAPLCRVTAVQVAALLELAGLAPRLQGDMISLSGFTVRIVTECTSLYACLLFGSFVLAQPASWKRTLTGLLAGTAALTAVNLLRIGFVTAVGPHVTRNQFDLLHVYLGQVVMLLLVLAAAQVWIRWSAGGSAPYPFLLRSMVIATVLFVPWVVVNRAYLALLDKLVAAVFSFLYPGYQLLTPRPLLLYNHTFAVPLFLALILAGRREWSVNRFAATVGGCYVIAVWHALFRGTHVIWTALDVPEIEPIHQGIYLLGQFLVPFLLWLWIDGRPERVEREGQVEEV
jgi:exosortase H (IPTLxxWG-CTERM-specific)